MGCISPRIGAGHSMLCPYGTVGCARAVWGAVPCLVSSESLRLCGQSGHGAGERGEGAGIERGDGAGEFGVVLGAAREKERVEAVEVGEESRGGAGFVGRGERFAVGVRVAPGLTQVRIGVERGAEVFGLGGGAVW